MGWFSRGTPTVKPRLKADLSDEELAEIELLLADGASASDLAAERNIAATTMNVLRRSVQSPISPTRRPVGGTLQADRIREEIELKKLEAERDRVIEDLEFQRELRKFTLEEKRMDLEDRRAEREEDDEFDPQELADNPNAALFSILNLILQNKGIRPGAAAPTSPIAFAPVDENPAPPPPLDMSRDQSDVDIRLELELLYSPEQIRQAKMLPEKVLFNGIREKYPSITDNNLKAISRVLAAYEV